MKKLFYAIVIIIAIIAALSFTKDMIIKAAVEKGVEDVTGLPLSIQRLNVGLVGTFIEVKDLTLYNPPDFTERTMINIPEVYVDFDASSILQGTIYLPEARLRLKEFIVVTNKAGKLNLDSLKAFAALKKEKAPPSDQKKELPKIKIDTLELAVGKVIYKNYAAEEPPVVKVFEVNIDERYEDITDPNALISLIVTKALAKTTIAQLTGFDLQGLKSAASGVVSGMTESAKDTAEEVKKSAEETAQKTVEETTEGIKDIIHLPFGKEEQQQ